MGSRFIFKFELMGRPDYFALEALEGRVLLDATPVALVSPESSPIVDTPEASAIVQALEVESVVASSATTQSGFGQVELDSTSLLGELDALEDLDESGSLEDSAERVGDPELSASDVGTLVNEESNFFDLLDKIPNRPLLLVHGIGGSMPSSANYLNWLTHRGYRPNRMLLDPIKGYYEGLMESLRMNGFHEGEDLFAANYDWRSAPGPTDGVYDGVIHNEPGSALQRKWGNDLSAAQITDADYDFGVDALGYWLVEAAFEWADHHDGVLPESVDIIAHSTGGLVVRSYIQSAAYGGELAVSEVDGELVLPGGQKLPFELKNPDGTLVTATMRLPTINQMVTMGVPMRGASTPYLLTQDDWGSDSSYEYLSKMVTKAYTYYLSGTSIQGPNGTTIRGFSPGDRGLDPKEFIALYCPTLKSLTATYQFIDDAFFADAFNDSKDANRLVIDLNDGLDYFYTESDIGEDGIAYVKGGLRQPARFVHDLGSGLVVVYNGEVATSNALLQHSGTEHYLSHPNNSTDYGVTPFWTNGQISPGATDVWYTADVAEGVNMLGTRGDGSVPEPSSIGIYRGVGVSNLAWNLTGSKVTLVALKSVESTHTGMLLTEEGQRAALDALGFAPDVPLADFEEYVGVGMITDYLGWDADLTCTPIRHSEGAVWPQPEPLVGRPRPAADPLEMIPALVDAQLEQFALVIDALRSNVLVGLTGSSELAEEVPILGTSLGASIDLLAGDAAALLTAGAAAVRALPAGSTVEALAAALQSVGVLAQGYGLHIVGDYVEIAIDVTSVLSAGVIPSLAGAAGAAAGELAVALLDPAVVQAQNSLRMQAKIRIALAQAQVAQSVAVAQYAAAVGMAAQQQAMSGAIQLGTAAPTTHSNSAIDVEAYVSQALADPTPGDGIVTVDEMAARTGAEQSQIQQRGRGRMAFRTDTSDHRVVYATTTEPFERDPDVFIDSINFALIKEKIREALDQLALLGDAMEDPTVQFALHVPLPFLGDPDNNTLDELLTNDATGFGLDEFFTIVDILREYCDEVQNPNLADFIDRVLSFLHQGGGEGPHAHGPFSITGGFDATGIGFRLIFKTDLSRTEEFLLTEEGLGAEADALGLELSIPASGTVTFSSEFALGMDLSGLLSIPSTGLSRNQVTLEFDHVSLDFLMDVPDIDATATLGFLEVGIVNGYARMTLGVDIAVNGNLPTTLAQLQSSPGSAWIQFTPAPGGTLDVLLPLVASLGGTNLTAGCSPTITLTDGNLFDSTPPQVRTSDFSCLSSFCSMTPEQALAMLKGLGDWLAQFRDSSVFDVGIPFTSGTDLGDVFDVSKAFIDKVYNQLAVREIAAVGAQTEEVATVGRLSGNARFQLAMDNGPPVLVSVLASSTASNQTLEDLVADFNAALTTAGLGATVETAINGRGRFALRLKKSSTVEQMVLTVPDADGNASTPNVDPMMTEMGFSGTQYSVETPDFSNIEEFSDDLSEALASAGIPLDVHMRWDAVGEEVRMDVSYASVYSRSVPFNFDPDLGLGPLLDASASGSIGLEASLGAGFTLGFDFSAKETPRVRTNGLVPPPSTGRITANGAFTLKVDGNRQDLVLLASNTAGNNSLAELVADINALFTAGNGLQGTVVAVAEGNSILLKVEDAKLGTVKSLQILGAEDSTFFTEVGFVDGDSDCGVSVGLFVENMVLNGSLEIEASGLEASLRVGVFSISVSGGTAVGLGSFNLSIQAPDGTLRFNLDDLFGAGPDFGGLLKVVPVLNASIDIHLPNLVIDPDLFHILSTTEIRIYLPDIRIPEYNPKPFDAATNPTGLFVTLPTLGGLSNFNCLTYLDILQNLSTLADRLQEMQGFGFLGKDIPLLNLSIGDILDYAGNIAEMVEGLATGNVDTIETLERDIEDFLNVSDRRLIDLTVEDFSPAALAGGSELVSARSRFNPSGSSNAIVFRSESSHESYNGTQIEFLDDGRFTGEVNDAFVEWSEANKRLRIYYHAGYTTADTVVAKVNTKEGVPIHADLDVAVETGGSGTVTLTALKFSLHYNLAYGSFHTLDLGFEDILGMLDAQDPAVAALGGISRLVQLEATGSLNVTANADLLIEFGIDVSNPCAWVPFLYDTTSLTLSAAIRGQDIELTAAVGALGVFAKDGSVTVDRDGDPTTTGDGEDATFRVGIRDVDFDGRHYFRDGLDFLGDVTVELEAGAGAELTLCFPTADIPLGSPLDNDGNGFPDNTLVLRIPDLGTLFDFGKPFVEVGGVFEVVLPCLGPDNDLKISTSDATLAAKKVRLVNLSSGVPRVEITADSILIHVDSGVTNLSALIALSTGQLTLSASVATEGSGTNNGAGKVCASVDLSLPDFGSILSGFNACDLVTNAPLLLDGLDTILGIIQSGLQSEVLSRNMPLVGAQLSKAGNFIEEFREGLLADIRAKLASAGDPIQLLRDAIWNVLGKPGLNLLDTSIGSATAVPVNCVVGSDGQMEIVVDLILGRTISIVDTSKNPIDIDIGIPGLGLDIDGNVTVELGWSFAFRFGISTRDGFFLDTNLGHPELEVSFEIAVPGLNATGDLLFLQIKVGDEDDGKDANGNVRKTTSFIGEFSVDLVDPNGDGRLSFAEMSGGGFDVGDLFVVTLDAKAEVHLDLEVSFADDARFPRILIEFDLVWCWVPTDAEGSKGDLDFGFHNLQIDLGQFISQFIIPILDEIQAVTAPLEPIIDILTARLPIFSDLAGETMTLLDLAELAGLLKPGTVEFIDSLGTIAGLINQFSVFNGKTILINVGGFDLKEDPFGNIDPFAPLAEYEIHPEEETTDTDAKGFLGDLSDLGFTFPFLKLSELFKLLTGQPVSLVEYHMPVLEFEARISGQIPIFPPLYIIFGGEIGAKIDLTFGFDTFGIQKYAASKDKNILDIFDGFYVKDMDDYGNEITELQLTGGLFAGAEIDLLIAEVGVTGGIFAEINFDLRDPDGDGRVRLAEIVEDVKEGPLCLFDVAGRLYVALDAFLEVHLLILDVDKEWRFGEITLLEFGVDCPVPILGSFDTDGDGTESQTEKDAGQFVLHMGDYAALRKYGNTEDGDERFTVRGSSPLSGGSQTIEVSYGGYKQSFAGVKSLLVKAGKGNDTVDLTGISVAATVNGGDGDDVIKAGRGGGVYRGDAGNDTLTAEEASDEFAGGPDTFYGGAGNDVLKGFEGDDILNGDEGDDELYGGDGVDTVDGGDGNDEIWGELGSDTLIGGNGVDHLFGDDGDDSLTGGEGDDTLDGGSGDDELVGNAGNDSLDGGAGNDVLVGDEGVIHGLLKITAISGNGNDVLAGGAGNDTLIGAGGNDFLYGGNHLVSGATTAVGVAYKLAGATLVADSDGADFLDGGEGDDLLMADDGHSGQSTTFPGAEVGDWVWLDLNQDGKQDEGEPGLAGVRLELHRASDATLVAFGWTDADGHFRFSGLGTGDYFLQMVAPTETSFAAALASAAGAELDSDFVDASGSGTGTTATFHLDAGQKRTDLDAGIRGGTPTVSIGDASVEEGDAGLAYLIFTVRLSSASSQVVTVNYETSSFAVAPVGYAAQGIDFNSVQYTVVFQPGVVSEEIRVAVIGDLKDELNEVVEVTLADAFQYDTSLTIVDATGTGTILDDDEAPVATISDASVGEVDAAGISTLTFTVTLSNPSWETLRVDWSLRQVTNADGSLAFDAAVVGMDYTDASGTLRFGEDVVSRSFTVSILGDALDEYDERLLAVIARSASTSSDRLEIGDDTGIGTIADNDATPSVMIRPAIVGPIAEGHAGNKPVDLIVSLSAASGRPVSVTWNTTRGTATDSPSPTEPLDYLDTFETLTFVPGETSKTTHAYIVGDTVREGSEHFFANLLTAINGTIGNTAAAPNHAVIQIQDDESGDPGPWYVQFSDATYTVTEGNTAVITLVRAGDSSYPVAVYWIAGGTADPGVDYDPEFNPVAGGQRGIVRFGIGETTKTFEIETYDNLDSAGNPLDEPNETILLQLANPQGGPVRGEIKTATVTIVDDDASPVITISDSPGAAHLAYETGGTLVFTVTLTGATTQEVKVDYTSISGTALAELDFTSMSGTLTFNATVGYGPQNIIISTKPDVLIEDYEDLFVVLSNPVNASIGDDPHDSDATGGEDSDDRGYGLILDDDLGTASGTVFFDANGNGFLDSATDYGYSGVQVTWTSTVDPAGIYSDTTDAAGVYALSLPLGDYTITVRTPDLPSGASATSYVLPYLTSFATTGMVLDLGYELPEAIAQPSTSSGSGTTGANDSVYGGAGSDVLSGGAGDDWLVGGHWLGPGCSCGGLPYDVELIEVLEGSVRVRVYVDPSKMPAPGVISGRVWLDSNGDNTENAATGLEAGMASVQVNLYDVDWVLVATAYTDSNGNYSFGNLTACDYRVQVLPPGGQVIVAKGVGTLARNSDADPTTGLTDAIGVAVGETEANIDVGLRAVPAGTPPWNLSFSHSIYSVRESDGFALIRILGDGNSLHPLTVYYTADGTAHAGDDYTALRNILRIGTGKTEGYFAIPIVEDELDSEGYETVLLYLQNPQGGPVNGAQSTAVLLIFDNPCPDDDEIEGGEGNDTLLGDFGYFSATGEVTLLGGMGNDLLDGGEGNDSIYGEGGNDTLQGGTGNDRMEGGSENDVYLFDTDSNAGTDTVLEGDAPLGGADTLDFSTTGLSVVIDLSGSSLQITNQGALVLDLTFTPNTLENVLAGSGNDILRGNDRNNLLRGNGGDDLLEGRGGNDELDGGAGNDTYLFDADLALGSDEIFEAANRDVDTIDFAGTTTQALALDLSTSVTQVVAPSLTLTLITASTQSVVGGFHVTLLLLNPFTGEPMPSDVSTGIENLYGGSFAPGVGIQDQLLGNGRDNIIWGREGNDVLDGGSSGYDTLKETRAGNWQLSGSTLANPASGEVDSFVAGTFDEISLTGDDQPNVLDASSFSGLVRLNGAGGDDTLVGGTGTNYLSGGEGNDTIDGSRGTEILTEERDADMTLSGSQLIIGVERDTLIGVIEEVELTGGDSDNTLNAGAYTGIARLHGRGGSDLLIGGLGNDLLDGGGGDDILGGGLGDDVYWFDADEAQGVDQVTENGGEGRDTLDFSATESLGVEVRLWNTRQQTVNGNLALSLSSDTNFEDLRGSQMDDVLVGNDVANQIEGLAGSDRITGRLGNDTLLGGDGVNTAGLAFTDILVEARNAVSTQLDATGLSFGGVIEDTHSGFEQAELYGGAGANRINAGLFPGTVRLDGGEGDDTLIGGDKGDILIGGGGDDDLRGGLGDDLYEFDADDDLGRDSILDDGGVDWLDFGGTTSTNVSVSLASTALQIVNVRLRLVLAAANQIENVRGGVGDDQLTGNALGNILEGGRGGDRLEGLEGDDLLIGGDGDDTYRFVLSTTGSLGSDMILEDVGLGGVDTLDFLGTASTPAVIDLGVGGAQGVHGSLELALVRSASIENVLGTPGDDTITGNSLANRLEGRGGNDTLDGELGDDIYAFDADAALGADTIEEEVLEGGSDTLDFSSTSTAVGSSGNPLTLSLALAQTVNAFLTLTIQNGDALENVTGGSGSDYITGNELGNKLRGGGGDDTLTGKLGDDILEGGTGNDTLDGGNDDDQYVFVEGDSGNDLLIESANHGVDTVDFSLVTTHAIVFALNVATTQAIWAGLTLTLSNADDFENASGGAMDDVLTGNNQVNALAGGSGRDRLLGRGGADTLAGGPGDDVYEFGVGAGNDLIVEGANEGFDILDFSAVGFDLSVEFNSSARVQFQDSGGLTHSITHLSDQVEGWIGGSGSDRVTVWPSLLTAFEFKAGGGLDVLTYVSGSGVALNDGTRIELGGYQSVSHRGFETVTLVEELP